MTKTQIENRDCCQFESGGAGRPFDLAERYRHHDPAADATFDAQSARKGRHRLRKDIRTNQKDCNNMSEQIEKDKIYNCDCLEDEVSPVEAGETTDGKGK